MEVVKVSNLGSTDQYQNYAPQDVALINTNLINGVYGRPGDYIEYFVKDLSGTVLDSNYYTTQYHLDNSIVDPVTGTTTQLYLDPETDAKNLGFGRGSVNVKYNFFTKQLASGPDRSINFWIKEISTSGLEIKVARQDLGNTELKQVFNTFNATLAADAYYPTFYLNFGVDVQLIGVNAVYVEEEGTGYIIFKLYEPLPSQFTTKSTFWVVTQAADSVEFNVSIDVTPEQIIDSSAIKGPNFKVTIQDKVGQTTPYYSYNSLLSTAVTSSYQQLQSIMQDKGIQINVDYGDFSNFIHFSSATERLYNFVYKLQLIESSSAGLIDTNTSTAKVLLQQQIDSTITNFDGYEYYLYFESASTAFPKQKSTQPYPLYSLTSSQAVNWLGSISTNPNGPTTMSMYWSSSYYDDNNKDLLLYATPGYVAEDPANAPYLVFLNMIGQHFDNIWIYLKDVTNHYSAENNPFIGISMDQVADALRSFGIQLYTNTSITDNIYYSMLGLNETGSALPVTSSAYSVVNIASSSLYPLAVSGAAANLKVTSTYFGNGGFFQLTGSIQGKFNLTSSTSQTDIPPTYYIVTGSTTALTAQAIATKINSLTSFNIAASTASSNVLMTASFTGSAGNSFKYVTSSIIQSFSEGIDPYSQPWLTASLSLPPFGEEKINRYVTTFVTQSSPTFNISQSFATLPAEQLTGEIYKRLYHNLAYLLKTRGTERGVKALITTFGIPGDILDPHEYGGYNIYQVPGIQEISNTKIITGSVLQISSSLLNPFTTIQYYQNDIDRSSNDIQIGFSPADSINADITSSAIVTDGTPGYFNIMQLIGAPDLQYSSSYIPLVELANTYFDAEYTSRYNVWDFIRVIKYYNNSVFKMLRDWVPARSSASTGIVIQSHMLERNKYPRHEPTFTNLSGSVQIKMIYISGSDGGAIQKNTYYVEKVPIQQESSASAALSMSSATTYISSSNNIQKYTGEFSGSTIVAAYNYFPQQYASTYAYPWTSSVAPSIAGANKLFLTYSIGPTFNNITGSVISQRFLDLDYNSNQIIPVNYGLITKSIDQTQIIGNIPQSLTPYSQYAYVQDYYYNLRSTVQLRYSGSYLQGKAYNTWSVGDVSYANDPVINYYGNQVGFFTQIQSSSFIPNAVNATIAYLADVTGGLYELNQNNKNWADIQNIFVEGTKLTVKQFDNKKYSNQVATDGIKTIYNSGYNYAPELYFNYSGSDQKIFFQFNGATSGESLLVSNSGSATVPAEPQNLFISGSTGNSPSYPIKISSATGIGTGSGYIYNIFDDQISDTANFYTPGNASTLNFPTYSAPYAGIRTFNTSFEINVQFPTAGQQVTYSFSVANQGITQATPIVQSFKSVQIASSYIPGAVQLGPDLSIDTSILTSALATVTGPFSFNSAAAVGDENSFITYGVFDYYLTSDLTKAKSGIFAEDFSSDLLGELNPIDSPGSTLIVEPPQSGEPQDAVDQLSTTLNFNSNVTINAKPNDNITFKLLEYVTASNSNYTASLSLGSLAVLESTLVGDYPFATASYVSDFNNQGQFGLITMSADITNFYGYQQVPFFVSGSPVGTSPVTDDWSYSSSLYNRYGDINAAFIPQGYDKLILKDKNGVVQNLNVYSSSFYSASVGAPLQLVINTVPTILPNWVLNTSLVQEFLLLSRYNDEQNVILTYTKPSGATSYGFLIPDTINPIVLQNINTLQAKVQSQLLSTQASTGTNVITP